VIGYQDSTLAIANFDQDSTRLLPAPPDGSVHALLVCSGVLYAAYGDDDPRPSESGMVPRVSPAIYSWKLPSGEPLPAITKHRAQVNALCGGSRWWFSASGYCLRGCGDENAIYRWSSGSAYPSCQLTQLPGAVHGICYAADADTLYSITFDGLVQQWCFRDRDGDFRSWWHEHDIDFVRFSPCGTYFVSASRGGPAIIGKTSDGSRISTLEKHENTFYAINFSSDLRRVVTGPGERAARLENGFVPRIWEVATGQLLDSLPAHDGPVMLATFSEDDRFIVTGTGDFNFGGRVIQDVYVWDTRTLRLVDKVSCPKVRSNASEVREDQVMALFARHGVRLPQKHKTLWRASRLNEFATALSRPGSGTAEEIVAWLPTVASNAETPYVWHPNEPICLVTAGPFLQLYRIEGAEP